MVERAARRVLVPPQHELRVVQPLARAPEQLAEDAQPVVDKHEPEMGQRDFLVEVVESDLEVDAGLRRPLKDLADAFLDAAAVGQVIAFVAPGEFFERWVLRTGEQELGVPVGRSEEHTSELQSLMRISYAVFCLKKKK